MPDDAPGAPPDFPCHDAVRARSSAFALLFLLFGVSGLGMLSYPYWPAASGSAVDGMASRQVAEWAQNAMMRDYRLHLFATEKAVTGGGEPAPNAAAIVKRADAAPAAGAPVPAASRDEGPAAGVAEEPILPAAARADLPHREIVEPAEPAVAAEHAAGETDAAAAETVVLAPAPDVPVREPHPGPPPPAAVAAVGEESRPSAVVDVNAGESEPPALPVATAGTSPRTAKQARPTARNQGRQGRSRSPAPAAGKAAAAPKAPVAAAAAAGERLQWRSVFDGS